MLPRPNAAGVNVSELLARGAREHAAGRLDAAAELYRRVLDLNGTHTEALSNLALVLGQKKQFAQAEEALKRALAHSPRHPAALANFALILHQQQKFADAIALCERALEVISETRHRQKLFNTLALSLLETQRYDEALALLGKMTAAHPRFAGGHHLMGLVYTKKADYEAALREFDRACQLDARNSESFLAAAECMLLQGKAEGALHRLDKVLSLNGYDVRALALKTLVLAELDRKDDERWLSDPHRLVHVHRLADLGYSDERIGDLNRRLSAFASNEPSLREDPPEYATRKAWHSTMNLAEVAHPAVDELKSFISYALKQRIASLKDEHPNHPFVKAAPPRCHIDLWAIKMKGGSNLFPHIHKDGWLSGVYYVDVPGIVDDVSADEAGWLKIGTPRRDLTLTRAPITRAVKPAPGVMVTFPSYFWHDTVPLPEDNTEQRLCLAFDLCPLRPGRVQ